MSKLLRVLALLTLAALLLAACGGSDSDDDGGKNAGKSGGSSKGSGCSGDEPTHKEQVDGIDAVRHCGDATGSVKYGSAEIEVSGGQCQTTDNSFVYNAGVTVLGGSAATMGSQTYLGILVGRHPAAMDDAPAADADGEYSKGTTVTATGNGVTLTLIDAEVTLADDRSKGTFTGTDATSGDAVTGEFDCG